MRLHLAELELMFKQKGERGYRRLDLTEGDILGNFLRRKNDSRGDVLRQRVPPGTGA